VFVGSYCQALPGHVITRGTMSFGSLLLHGPYLLPLPVCPRMWENCGAATYKFVGVYGRWQRRRGPTRWCALVRV